MLTTGLVSPQVLTSGNFPGSTPLGSLGLDNEVLVTILRQPDAGEPPFQRTVPRVDTVISAASLRSHPRKVLSSSRKYLDIIFLVRASSPVPTACIADASTCASCCLWTTLRWCKTRGPY